ncbi:MAG: hypothetical protein Q8O46_02660 [bacterium]|nr:hypothetical protein [bacterium]
MKDFNRWNELKKKIDEKNEAKIKIFLIENRNPAFAGFLEAFRHFVYLV